MDKYIPKGYKEIIDMLEPIIDEYDLDKISVESLVRSSIEVEEQPVQPVTMLWKSKDGNIYSAKPSNIKMNLRFALSTAFRMKTVISQKDLWLALAIVHLVVDLFAGTVKKIDEISGLILLAVYRLQSADEKRIFEYAKEICPEEKLGIINETSVKIALDHLEEWGCIKLEQGRYVLNETVSGSMAQG